MSQNSQIPISLFFLFLFTLLILIQAADAVVEEPVITSTTTFGNVTIQGQPGTSISIDGLHQGIIPENRTISCPFIIPGEHQILASKSGYQDQEIMIMVKTQEEIQVPITLNPAFGTIQIFSSPQNVQAYLDDEYKGITPLAIPKVPAGSHRVLLRLAGYQDQELQALSVPGEERRVTGEMKEISTAGRTSGLLIPTILSILLLCLICVQRKKE